MKAEGSPHHSLELPQDEQCTQLSSDQQQDRRKWNEAISGEVQVGQLEGSLLKLWSSH